MTPPTKKTPLPKEVVKERLRERKKVSKQKIKEKRARLMVKNLSFKVTEEALNEYFGKYGEVANVTLLKKADGKLVGCGFVQFKLVQKAAKAKYYTNGKTFLGRQLIVDFAKPKNKHEKISVGKTEVKEEKTDSEDEIAIVESTGNELADKELKIEKDSNESKSEHSEESNNEHDDNESDIVKKGNNTFIDKNPRIISHDVAEGKTIFIKNVPFNARNDDLKSCMLQFGPVYYALVCIDKLTEHSKGTAFVKFVNKEDADKALSAGTELTLLGTVLDCHPAVDKNEINKKLEIKKSKTQVKDSRNLYLVKEGVILAGTKAAEGVSASDMAKRLQIEQYKTQMLRKLNMFVSRERLVVHNLPSSWDDKKLRILCEKYGGPDAVIREARIMRDLKNIDASGLGKSKEYGFVSFTKHENALTALRHLNNNPNIFSKERRPIITFSIENKSMLLAKQKRLEKSRLNNPRKSEKNRDQVSEEKSQINTFKTKRKRKDKLNKNKNSNPSKNQNSNSIESVESQYSGVQSKPGTQQKMRGRYKLAVQAKLHNENLKKEKQRRKNAKKTLAEKKRDFIKQPKQKINKRKETDNFSKLVNEYKAKLVSTDAFKKSKWYESN